MTQGCAEVRGPGLVSHPNFGRFVLGCIDADFCNDRLISLSSEYRKYRARPKLRSPPTTPTKRGERSTGANSAPKAKGGDAAAVDSPPKRVTKLDALEASLVRRVQQQNSFGGEADSAGATAKQGCKRGRPAKKELRDSADGTTAPSAARRKTGPAPSSRGKGGQGAKASAQKQAGNKFGEEDRLADFDQLEGLAENELWYLEMKTKVSSATSTPRGWEVR